MFALTPFVPIKNVIFEKNPDSKERDFDTMESRTKTGILNAMKIDYFQGCQQRFMDFLDTIFLSRSDRDDLRARIVIISGQFKVKF